MPLSTSSSLRSYPDGLRAVARLAAGCAAALALLAPLGSCAGDRPTLGAIAPRTTVVPTSTTSTAAATSTTSTTSTAAATSTTSTAAATSTTSATSATASTLPVATTSTTSLPSSTASLPPTSGGRSRTLGPDDLLGFIATPTGTPVVRAGPDAGAAPVDIATKTSAGAPTTFAIVGDASPTTRSPHPGWFEVVLPTRPNGATAWVPASSVKVTSTPMRMFVDLGARRLRVENGGKQILDTEVAIGTTTNPTPTGASYVTELIENVNPAGTYGPYAFGLALHSDTLTEFAGGPGQVGIHGTNTPNLIGQPVSHGCVRLTNDAVRKLVALELPLGVPVFIT